MVDARERKMIFRAGPIDMFEINAHTKGIVLFGNHDDIGEPLRVIYLEDELSGQESSHFLANCLPLLRGGATEMLFDRFGFWVDSQMVLNQSPGYTWHVKRFPCEDVPVLMEELDERFFLFGVECC